MMNKTATQISKIYLVNNGNNESVALSELFAYVETQGGSISFPLETYCFDEKIVIKTDYNKAELDIACKKNSPYTIIDSYYLEEKDRDFLSVNKEIDPAWKQKYQDILYDMLWDLFNYC